jgi:hypothetical protein
VSRSGSTDKHDMRRALCLDRFLQSWDKVPDKKLGQLIVEGLDMQGAFDISVLRNIEDTDLLEAIERHLAGLRRPA